ncbi:MAG TPA: type II toxin-antitoxin system PemK/MazF family toxin [Vicinamibacterales bacterium]|nr:type II toxin-antitoxin system PemK/MazF family toxin [Vicinamibacterales bacterium]
MNRGDVVVVATRGAYTGKPRPALVVQDDLFNDVHASITVCLVTSQLIDAPLFRVTLPAGSRTGLDQPSQVMIDKIVSVPRESIGRAVGRCTPGEMETIDAALRQWLAL